MNIGLGRENFRRLFASRRRRFSLRMAPMIDVIFLLLIFFLVAAKWRPKEDFLPLQLASGLTQDPQAGKIEPLTITIEPTQDGCQVQIGLSQSVQIHQEYIEADLAELMETVKETLHEQKRFASDPLEIICHGQVKWDYVEKIYNVFYGIGLNDITFLMTED
ncbi:biopolymer transporter ExbD [Planctomycetota bacterium]